MARSHEQIVPFTSEPLAVPDLALPRGYSAHFKPDYAAIAAKPAEIGSVISSRGDGAHNGYPGFICVTDPRLDVEPFLPSRTIGDRGQHVSGTGRVLDITILNKTPGAHGGGQSNTYKYSVLDEAYMAGAVGMEADVTAAAAHGGFSPFWQVCRRMVKDHKTNSYVEEHYPERDIFFITTPNNDGDLVVRSVISGDDPHNQDGMLVRTHLNERGNYEGFTEEFLDELAYKLATGKINPGVPNQELASLKEQLALSSSGSQHKRKIITDYILALNASLLNPDYSIERDKSLHPKAKKMAETTYKNIMASRPGYGSPALPYLRAAELLDELRVFEDHTARLSPAGRRALNEQRARIIQSVVAAKTYLSAVYSSRKLDDSNSKQRQTMQDFDLPHEFGPIFRFEAFSMDPLDRLIGNTAAAQISRMSRRPETEQLQGVLMGVVNQLKASRDAQLVIRAHGSNKLMQYRDLTMASEGDIAASEIIYNGTGIPHEVAAHYPHEIISSLRRPYEMDPRFGAGGLAVSGIVARFNVPTEVGIIPCTVISAKRFAWGAVSRILKSLYGAGRKVEDLREIVDGSIGLVGELESKREQRWRIGSFTPTGVDVLPEVFTNGSAFALVRNGNGIDDVYGRIPHQKKHYREGTGLRDTKRGAMPKELPLPQYPGNVSLVNTPPADHTGARALYEVRFANGAVYSSASYSGREVGITAVMAESFIDVKSPQERRQELRDLRRQQRRRR